MTFSAIAFSYLSLVAMTEGPNISVQPMAAEYPLNAPIPISVIYSNEGITAIQLLWKYQPPVGIELWIEGDTADATFFNSTNSKSDRLTGSLNN